ncbi:hypothetical protein [Bradyrhizobium sp. CCBAU 65884]|uniref:hypothetical protein n=1 Tax=Bradyrhizobium sp. CCBAU 65884 TaxID=722477 RepID=UPI002305A6C4|nr:hypothetical protein [Bradyrhizobium sp. CCBAU 65884]
MAEKGYLLAREDQAEAKQAELAAIAQQKKQQESAAAAKPFTAQPTRKPKGAAGT